MNTEDFFLEVAKRAGFSAEDSVLAVCGGGYDRRVLLSCGVKSAVISNVSHHAGVDEYAPYTWEYQDAENLTVADKSYDWVIVHAGLRHCASPHRALCEMLRVAKKGVMVVEARDSMVVRIAQRFGLTPDFELEPALLTGGKSGGYRDTPIPNYIYRWKEREVEKTVLSFEPDRVPEIEYVYGWRLPVQRMAMSRSPVKRLAVNLLSIAKPVLETLARKQGNCFGFIIRRSGGVPAWIKTIDGAHVPDLEFIGRKYDPAAYRRKNQA